MRTTAAVREFTGDPVPDEVLFRILDRARFAPSGGNQQGWHVTVLRDRERRRHLADLCSATWTRYVAEQVAGHRAYGVIDPAPPDVEVPDEPTPNPFLDHIEDVPVVLVVTVDLATLAVLDRDLDRWSIVGGASIYPFVHNLLLAARDEGLGGVMTTFLAASEPEVAPVLGLPDGHAIAAMVGIGRPVHQATTLRRNPVASFTTIDTVDGDPFTG
ncbi:MAG: nitroreductase family protein [Actinobacteria bacterium]|nr:nitroreductase family protein [Actinomycetota bacterium]